MDIFTQGDIQTYAQFSQDIVEFDGEYDVASGTQKLDLWGPVHILSGWSDIILNVLYLRIIHLLVDLCNLKPSNIIKDLATVILGLIQLTNYAGHFGLVTPVTALIVYYTAFVIIRQVWTMKKRSLTRCRILYLIGTLAVPLFVNEFCIFFYQWQKLTVLRTILSCIIMKSSSIILTPQIPNLNISSSVAYLIHPAASIFGVWQPMKSAKAHTRVSDGTCKKLSKFTQQVFIGSAYFLKTIIILIIDVNLTGITSNIESAFDHALVNTILRVYRVALEFRISHYFTGYLSTSLIRLWQDPAIEEGFLVCQPFKIEFPRSLLEVVRFWNLPMHHWLKSHVFWPVKEHKSSIYISLGLTYIISSMLHGFKFHIWSVLLTLGFLTWTEHQLRIELARRLSACVLSSRCRYNSKSECSRGHKRIPNNSILVHVINLTFTALAMIHLAYLGYIFVGNTDEARYTEALARWSELYYFAHLTSIVTYISLRVIQRL